MSAALGNETPEEKVARLEGLVRKLEKDLKDSEANCNRIIAASQRGDKVDVLQLELSTTKLEDQVRDLERQVHLRTLALREVEQYLGIALEYPWYCHDQKNFPNCTEADGVCIGEHVTETIAMEAARKIVNLKAELSALKTRETLGHLGVKRFT